MKIGIYGLGRFGYLWAEILSTRCQVVAFNRTAGKICPSNVALVSEDDLFSSDIIFFCVAISVFEDVIRRTCDKMRQGSIVLDTCSVKVFPVTIMKKYIPKGVHIIGSHPMFGPDSVKNGIEGLPIVFSPARAGEDECDLLKGIFADIGLRRVDLSPDEHDKEAAYTQGITHFIGRVLEDLSLTESPIATIGYRKILEVVEQTCNDPWQLFLDLQWFNPYTKQMRERMQSSLSKIMKELR